MIARVRLVQWGAAAAGAAAFLASFAIWPWIESTAEDAAEKEATRVAQLEASSVALTTVSLVTAKDAAKALLGIEGFAEGVASAALRSLDGSVVAFVSGCPSEGWRPYGEAAGRFILGAGKGTLTVTGDAHNEGRVQGAKIPLKEVAALDQGGAETHTLTDKEMPRHDHTYKRFDIEAEGAGYSIPNGENAKHNEKFTSFKGGDKDLSPGESKPHNNMPPYIALYFCKKEG